MPRIKVKITKYQVRLIRVNEDNWSEADQSRVGEYDMETSIEDSYPDARQRAISEAASKVSGMNDHAISAAKDLNKSSFTKLIITSV